MAGTIVISVLCGLGTGVLSGILGIGGGVVIIPLLRLGFGVDALVTAGTSLLVILPTSISGVVGRLRGMRKEKAAVADAGAGSPAAARTINLKAGLLVGAGGVVLSPAGSWLTTVAGGPVVMVVAAVIIAYTGINMARKALRAKSGQALEGDSPALAFTAKNVVRLLTLGAIAGLLSGFIGLGGGFIIIPMLMWMFDMSFKEASGTSLAALCIIATPGIIAHGLLGHVDFVRGLALAAGSIPGAQLGSNLLKRLPEKTLRIVFGIVLVVVAVTLATNELL